MPLATFLPVLNATLNALSALLLVSGYAYIRRGKTTAHKRCMLAAFGLSTLFLVSYLTLRAVAGMTHFTGQGWIRPVYFSILFSHTILAAGIVPMVLLALVRALRGDFERHVHIARRTLPLWLYVSVTGVVIYWLLYHLYPSV
jgi:putative membrane protein